MIDLQVYRWGGEMARQHRNVYDLKFEGFLSFTYTPLAVMAFEAMSHLSLGALRFVMTGASIGALAGALWVAWGLAGVTSLPTRAGLALGSSGVALGLEPVAQTLGFGQINLLLLFLILVDLALPDRRRWKGAGVGLAAAIKLTPAIFIAYLALTRRFRAAAAACGTLAAGVGLGFLALPGPSRRFWLGGLFLNSERVGGVAYAGNQSMNGVLVRLLGGVTAARPAWFVAAAFVGGAGLALSARASRRGEELLGITTCGLTALLVSPISWSHHWVWIVLLVPCATGLLRRSRWVTGWPAIAVLVAAFLAAFLAGPVRLIWRPPNTGNIEYGWHGGQLLAGNLYVVLGLLLLGLAALYLATGEKGGASRVGAARSSQAADPAGANQGLDFPHVPPYPLRIGQKGPFPVVRDGRQSQEGLEHQG